MNETQAQTGMRNGTGVDAIPVDDPRWLEFTRVHPGATPFHLPAWVSTIADCYRFDAFVLAVLEKEGEILAGVPTLVVGSRASRRRWVSLPFTDLCPLLVRDDISTQAVVDELREHVLASRVRELEVRFELPPRQDCYPVNAGYHQFVKLPPDPRDLHPKKNHRNARNRAQRKGVRITRGNTRDDIATYYQLHTLTRRRLGVPVQPRRFFELLGERMLARGHGFVATATLDGEVVAAGLYLGHNGTLVAKFGASDPARQDTGAGYLIDWEIMASACTEGYHTLDLGRTDLDADGLRLYKAGWGAVERPLVYTHVSRRSPATERPHVGGVSRQIIRHSPVWVCRALGELLYRGTA